MTTRTFQFYGQGYGPETAEITVDFNGQNIYQGPIPTVPSRPLTGPEFFTPVLLFTGGEIDVEDTGTFPLTVTVTAGNLILADMLSNYVPVPNPVFSPQQFAVLGDPTKEAESFEIIKSLANPPFTADELAQLENLSASSFVVEEIRNQHGVTTFIGGADHFSSDFWPSDSRSNVAIDGVLQLTPDPRPAGLTGDWSYDVLTNQVLTCQVNVLPGIV